jgi:hypothetical protein
MQHAPHTERCCTPTVPPRLRPKSRTISIKQAAHATKASRLVTPAATLCCTCYHATCTGRQAADAARQQLDKSAAAEKALEHKLRGLRTTAAGLKADSSSSTNQSVVVQALLEAKRKGEIPGVYGRLGDLGSIDSK